MGVFDRFERGLERAVNGAFAKVFRSEVQPVEIAGALRKECDTHAAIMGRDRTIVPNNFTVALSPVDHDRLGEWEAALSDELKAAVMAHAEQQRYVFVGSVRVTIERGDDLTTGLFRVDSSTSKPGGGAPEPPASPAPRASSYAQSAQNMQPAPSVRSAPAVPSAPPGSGRSGPAYPPVYPPVGAPVAPAPRPSGSGNDPVARRFTPPGAGENAGAGGALGGVGAGSLDDLPFHRPAGQPGPGQAGPGQASPGRPSANPAPPSWVPPQPVQVKPPTVTLDIDGTVHTIGSAVTVLGRGSDADVMIDDAGVSRRHAEVHVRDGVVSVVDLGSTNGTFLNGKKVHNAPVTDGAVVTVGRTRILLRIIPG